MEKQKKQEKEKVMSKTLIIPDIHLQWKKAEKIIQHESADKVVFLGDYFDAFEEKEEDNLITAQWLLQSLHKPNRIHLIGNHDISYAGQHRSYKCSGYSVYKDYQINSVLKAEHWSKLKLYTWTDGFLCSHAGVHFYFYDKYVKIEKENNRIPSEFKDWLERTCDYALQSAWKGQPAHQILQAGMSRGGNELVGGITWCDSTEFSPIPGIDQIFGHTPREKPRFINVGDVNSPEYSTNLALDNYGHSNYYAVIIDGKITIKWVGDM